MTRRERIRAMIEARSVREDRGYKDPVTGEPSLCRIWTGGNSGKGYHGKKKGRGHSYGRMNLDGATVSVHKAAWVNENGIVPPKKQLGHLCHQRDCSDESHLELCTHLKNQRDKRLKPLTMDNGGDVPDFRTLRVGAHNGFTMLGEDASGHGERGPSGRMGTPGKLDLSNSVSHDAQVHEGVYVAGVMAPADRYDTTSKPWQSHPPGSPEAIAHAEQSFRDYCDAVPAPDGFDPNNPSDRTYRGPVAAVLPSGATLYIPNATVTPAPEVIDE